MPNLEHLNPSISGTRLCLFTLIVGGITVMPACNGCPSKPTTRQLSWRVYNQTTGVNTYYSDGDTVGTPPKEAFSGGTQYTVYLLAQDPNGIQELDVSGVGNGFTCHGADGHQFTPLSAQIQPPTPPAYSNPSNTFYGSLATTPFVYAQLDCGWHNYGSGNEDYLVQSGTLTVTGSETSGDSTKQAITLKMGY